MAEEKDDVEKAGMKNEPASSRLLKEKDDEDKIDINLLPEMSARQRTGQMSCGMTKK